MNFNDYIFASKRAQANPDQGGSYEQGKADGYATGYEAGKQAEHKAFMDEYQDYGNRTDYERGFIGYGFNGNNFYPEHDIVPTKASRMFENFPSAIDLVERLNEQGVILDLSKATGASLCFNAAKFTHIGVCDFSSIPPSATSGTTTYMYNYAVKLKIIDGVVMNKGIIPTQWFNSCTALEHMIVSGVIGQNGFNVQWSTKLDHESLISILNALEDKTSDTSGTTWVVTIGTENIAKLTESELKIATDKGWKVE